MKSIRILSKVWIFALFLGFTSCAGVLTEPLEPEVVSDSQEMDPSSRSAGEFGANPVRLLYAQPFVYSALGSSWDQVYFYVHVKNIGASASRTVAIHWNNGGTWVTTNMSLEGDYGTHSRYSLILSGAQKEFVVRFVSSAGTYWDNNGGANYRVNSWGAVLPFQRGAVGGNIGLNQSQVTTYGIQIGTTWQYRNRVTADIAVENLGSKQVGLRYSINNGLTWSDANAVYQYSLSTGGSDKVEIWRVVINNLLPGNIRFAAFYRDLSSPGVEYWDNNFSQNYHQPLVVFSTHTIR